MLQSVFERIRSLLSGRCSDLLIEQTPTRRRYDQPTRNLDDRKRDTEKREDFTSEQERHGEQSESVRVLG